MLQLVKVTNKMINLVKKSDTPPHPRERRGSPVQTPHMDYKIIILWKSLSTKNTLIRFLTIENLHMCDKI